METNTVIKKQNRITQKTSPPTNITESENKQTETPHNPKWLLMVSIISLMLLFGGIFALWPTTQKLPEMAVIEESDVSRLVTILPGQLSEPQIAAIIKACQDGNAMACEYLKKHKDFFLQKNQEIHNILYGLVGFDMWKNMQLLSYSYNGISIIELLSMSEDEFCSKGIGPSKYKKIMDLICLAFNISEETVACLREKRKEIFEKSLGEYYKDISNIRNSTIIQVMKEELDFSINNATKIFIVDLFIANFRHNNIKGLVRNHSYLKEQKLKPVIKELMFNELRTCL